MWLTDKASEVTSERLTSLYAYPPGGAYVRANMVASIDGAAGLEGRSGGLGGPGDRKIFSLLRACADVVVVGASTAVTEGYHQPDGPALALVSRSLSIPDDYGPLSHPQTVVLTCASAPEQRRADLGRVGATLLDCGTDTVDPAAAIAACVERGWTRILLEGGPRLLGSFVAADALDELCLTTSPVIVGGSAPRPVVVDAEKVHPMTRAHLLSDDDGYLYARWIRGTDQAPGDA
ncbi:MAG TPA: dihydrofolate reductase family protein [Gordonia sp. (in: high G+C Gram-positive bacteria)]|uniref:dihydrofolate reductase family protein n=1 Tax=unclassified Gordonia (in: high G+C Gram-positive bacteria) TaxID=2657482 RepID=UPI000FB11A46|nr:MULTISPECIES: dihydrofolate reductase family protein [unclassified Gordonia (in: high G+C Gram-positive bacteria)]RUP41342.1 MAG: pyrimidine reductase family protein [Gordonia sp. (in: high G+C Gram-positive bacteria)]HNP58124.1 dihydrofolate reductase family protein [Gordonia sp. (in: high G+C Gram-positive bacteria)]HRC50459.1 dihydrofolate reductase family protein [Gordonia sp. (in: high G+C Gram-positive bacteria)]